MFEKSKSIHNWEASVPNAQYWAGTLKWDVDSSPKAWAHYQKYYTIEHWPGLRKYDLNNPVFFEALKNKYINSPLSEYNRCYALETGVEPNSKGYYASCLRLGGETDFNFKEIKYNDRKNKYKRFYELIKTSKFSRNKRQQAIALLDKCKNMHDSLLNFSLIQTMGGLQLFKSEGLIREEGDYEYFDRLDTLIYYLDIYYKMEPEEREKSEIIMRQKARPKMRSDNVDALKKDYLDTFADIYEYCDKVYFIKINKEVKYTENDFVQKLIESGKKELRSGDDVIEYMELAVEFWKKKREYFENIS